MDTITQNWGGHRHYNFEFRHDDVFTKFVVDLRIKNGVAVDPQSCHVQGAHVYQDQDGNIYSAYLTETDVENRKNFYRKLQILRSDDSVMTSRQCWLFQTYGGIGAAGYMYNETEMTLTDAVDEFKAIFEKLTGNLWESRDHFRRIRGKMNLLEIVYTPNVVNVDDQISTRLTRAVYKMVKAMVYLKPTMSNLPQIQTRDSRKWPMGKLSEKNIELAQEVLGQLLDCVADREEDEIDEKTVYRCTNLYYSLVPRASISDSLKLLNTTEAIQYEYEFLDSLPTKLRSFSSIDTHYANLSTKLRDLDSDEPFHQILVTCVRNTGNVEVDEIFELNRHGEDKRFSDFKNYENKKLLWHGSPLSNFERIFSQGLIIRGVACSGLFGTGIYFSDMVAKSMNYCRAYGGVGYLLLCEVALGKIESMDSRSIGSNGTKTKAANGYDSVMVHGKTVPDPNDDIELDDRTVLSMGRGVPSSHLYGQNSRISYNEYVVYGEAQVKMRYLVKFRHQVPRP